MLDQAEELFTLPPDQAVGLLERIDGVRVVLSIRTDRLAEASRFPPLARLLERGLFLLGGIDAEGLRWRWSSRRSERARPRTRPGRPAAARRRRRARSAADVLPCARRDLATPRRSDPDHRRVLSAGGVRGAVAQTAESLYAALDPSRHHELRSLMLRLVRTNDEGETSRARVRRHRIAVADDLVEQLVAARLLSSITSRWPSPTRRSSRPGPGSVTGSRTTSRAGVSSSTSRRLRPPGRRWTPGSELYRGTRLERAVAWAGTTPLELSETEQDFLAASRDAQRAEQERERQELDRQRRINRRLRGLASGLAVVTALAVVAGVLAVGQQRRAVAETRASAAAELEADANRVAALALNTDDAQLSLLLAVAAERLAPGVVTAPKPVVRPGGKGRADRHRDHTTERGDDRPSGLGDLASGGSRVYGLDDRHVLHVFTTGLRPLGTVDLGERPHRPWTGPARRCGEPGGRGRRSRSEPGDQGSRRPLAPDRRDHPRAPPAEDVAGRLA